MAVNAASGPTRQVSRLELSNQTIGSHFFVLMDTPGNSPISPVKFQDGHPTFVISPVVVDPLGHSLRNWLKIRPTLVGHMQSEGLDLGI